MSARRAGAFLPLIIPLILLTSSTSAKSVGCGEPATTYRECGDIHCPRVLGGYCVRGLAYGESCSKSEDCQLAACVTAQQTPCPANGTVICRCTWPAPLKKDIRTGVTAALLAAVAYGTMYVPLKHHVQAGGLGVFVQWLMCAGAWLVGAGFALTRSAVALHPLAVGGGAVFSLANILAPVLTQLMGPPLGMALWSTASMFTGWAISYYGLLGAPSEESSMTTSLMCVSLVATVVSSCFYANVSPRPRLTDEETVPLVPHLVYPTRHTTPPTSPKGTSDQSFASSVSSDSESDCEKGPRKRRDADCGPPPSLRQRPPRDEEQPGLKKGEETEGEEHEGPVTWADRLPPFRRRLLGLLVAVVAGIGYGGYLLPVLYMTNKWDTLTRDGVVQYSPHALDYLFSVLSGVLLGATGHTLVAVLGGWVTMSSPSNLLFVAITSGALWGGGQALFLYAIDKLSLAAAGPVVAAATPVISSFYGIAVFRDISGSRNYQLLGVALVLSVVGIVAMYLSYREGE